MRRSVRTRRSEPQRFFLVKHPSYGSYLLYQKEEEKSIPFVPNYKSFQESWRVKPSQSLTKIIEKNIKIYDIKYVYYENIANKESNDT